MLPFRAPPSIVSRRPRLVTQVWCHIFRAESNIVKLSPTVPLPSSYAREGRSRPMTRHERGQYCSSCPYQIIPVAEPEIELPILGRGTRTGRLSLVRAQRLASEQPARARRLSSQQQRLSFHLLSTSRRNHNNVDLAFSFLDPSKVAMRDVRSSPGVRETGQVLARRAGARYVTNSPLRNSNICRGRTVAASKASPTISPASLMSLA